MMETKNFAASTKGQFRQNAFQSVIYIRYRTILYSTVRLLTLLLILSPVITGCSSTGNKNGRTQWTEAKAWQWEKETGIIKGFNAPVKAHPDMKREAIFKKASELGYNSFRIWVPSEPDRCISYMHQLLDEAEKYNLTVSPVLGIVRYFDLANKDSAEAKIRTYLSRVIGEFRDDPRIIFWDLVNEPALFYFLEGESMTEKTLEYLEWCERSMHWAREISPEQPLTISALYLPEHIYMENEVIAKFREVAGMSDIHNFHLYDLSRDQMKAIDDMVSLLKDIRDVPIVCTEAVARTRGGTFARSLTAFSKYRIHFYNWGLYVSDANWHVAWNLSAFEPYEPWFHDVLHPDGTPYDHRDLEWIRNFHFSGEGEVSDPGAEITERWTKWRAWKWMATETIKGSNIQANTPSTRIQHCKKAAGKGYNAVRLKLDLTDWQEDSSAFFQKTDRLIQETGDLGIRVMPVLLTDADMEFPEKDIGEYVRTVVKHYGFNPVIHAWEIYNRPGASGLDKAKVSSMLKSAFRSARFVFPNQPLTATPCLEVSDFDPGFDYHTALIHGHRNGWDRLKYTGSGDAELCNLVWSLSDIIAVDTEMNMPETGWLLSVANRYGRPVVCTQWTPPGKTAFEETLALFSKNKVYWYANNDAIGEEEIKGFGFNQIATPFR